MNPNLLSHLIVKLHHLVPELRLIQMARRVSDYRIRRIADRGNEEDGPDSRARGDRFYRNRRSADRGNEKVDRDPGNISEIKGLRRRVRDLEIQHEIRQIRKRIRELELQREMRKETESRYVVQDDVNEEKEYHSFDSYPRFFEPICPDFLLEDEPRFDEDEVDIDESERLFLEQALRWIPEGVPMARNDGSIFTIDDIERNEGEKGLVDLVDGSIRVCDEWSYENVICDRKSGKGKDRIDEEDITFQRMVAKMQEVAGERGGYLHGRGALDSDDLFYLKEQMEAEEDAERLLSRTEKQAFAAFKKAASLADSSPAPVPLPLRVEPKTKTGIRQQDLLKKVVEVKPKRQKVMTQAPQQSLWFHQNARCKLIKKTENQQVQVNTKNENQSLINMIRGDVPYDPGGCGSELCSQACENSRTSFFRREGE